MVALNQSKPYRYGVFGIGQGDTTRLAGSALHSIRYQRL